MKVICKRHWNLCGLADEYPTNLEVANDVAVILAGLGRLNEARKVLEVAFQKHPKVGKAFINLREILARQASVEYRKALDKNPQILCLFYSQKILT